MEVESTRLTLNASLDTDDSFSPGMAIRLRDRSQLALLFLVMGPFYVRPM